jgi:hypothetical protein
VCVHTTNFITTETKALYFLLLFLPPNIIRMINSRRMGWAGHVARMGETRNAYRILVGKPEGKRLLTKKPKT